MPMLLGQYRGSGMPSQLAARAACSATPHRATAPSREQRGLGHKQILVLSQGDDIEVPGIHVKASHGTRCQGMTDSTNFRYLHNNLYSSNQVLEARIWDCRRIAAIPRNSLVLVLLPWRLAGSCF